jgi:sorting nexin-4
MYPYAIVPPIPEKHSVKDYASKPGKAKENPEIIHKRKRMLESFLNRVAVHPTLSGLHIFHQFLKGDGTWADILAMSGLSFHLKKKTPGKVGEKTVKNPGNF